MGACLCFEFLSAVKGPPPHAEAGISLVKAANHVNRRNERDNQSRLVESEQDACHMRSDLAAMVSSLWSRHAFTVQFVLEGEKEHKPKVLAHLLTLGVKLFQDSDPNL